MRIARAIMGFSDHREKRRDKRRLSPTIEVSFDGETYRTMDWSLGGVLLSDYYGPRESGDEIKGQLHMLTDMRDHSFKAVIVRRNMTSGQLALNFTDLSNSAFSSMEAAIMGRFDL